MARPVYSTRFAALQGTSGIVELAPVPPGVVWVIRDIDVYRNDTETVWYLVGATLLDGTFPTFAAVQLSDIVKFGSWRGRQVLYPNEALHLQGASDEEYDVWISGYELTAPDA